MEPVVAPRRPTTVHAALVARLQTARVQRQWTYEVLAEQTGLDPTTVWRLLNRITHDPQTFAVVARALGMEAQLIDDLLGPVDEAKPKAWAEPQEGDA